MIYILAYEMYASDFGLKGEEHGIKTPIPIRIQKGKKISALNGFHAQTLLETDLKRRFGQDKQVVITSCVSEQADALFQRAKKKLSI